MHALPKLLETLGVKKALIVTGRSLYEKVTQPILRKRASLTCEPDRSC